MRSKWFRVLFFPAAAAVFAAFLTAGQEAKPVKSILIPEGTTVSKTAEGCLLFSLPDGCQVKGRGFQKDKPRSGILGGCGSMEEISVKDGSGKLIAVGKASRLVGNPGADQKPEAGRSLVIDGMTVLLPATLEISQPRVFDRVNFARMTAEAEGRKKN